VQQFAELRVGQILVILVWISHKPQLGGSNQQCYELIEPHLFELKPPDKVN
jgi:hypothetical protein